MMYLPSTYLPTPTQQEVCHNYFIRLIAHHVVVTIPTFVELVVAAPALPIVRRLHSDTQLNYEHPALVILRAATR